MENTNNNNVNNNYNEISLSELFRTLWRGKVLIAIITVLAVILAAIASFFVIPEEYRSSVTLIVNPIIVSSTYSGEDAKAFTDLESIIILTPEMCAEKLKSKDFLNILAEEINLNAGDDDKITSSSLGGLISTKSDDKVKTVTVTVNDTDPERAYNIVNHIEVSFMKYIEDFINDNVELYNTSLQNNISMTQVLLKDREVALYDFIRENGSTELLTDEVDRLKARIKDLNIRISRTDSEINSNIASLDTLIRELENANAIDESQLNLIAELKQIVQEGAGNEVDISLHIETGINGNSAQISQSVGLLELSRLQMKLLNNYNTKTADIKHLEEVEELYQDKKQELTEVSPIYARYQGEYDAALASYTSFMKREIAAKVYAELDIASSYITIERDPVKPKSPVSPNKMSNIAIGLVSGIAMGVILVFVRDYWRKRVKK